MATEVGQKARKPLPWKPGRSEFKEGGNDSLVSERSSRVRTGRSN